MREDSVFSVLDQDLGSGDRAKWIDSRPILRWSGYNLVNDWQWRMKNIKVNA